MPSADPVSSITNYYRLTVSYTDPDLVFTGFTKKKYGTGSQ